MRKLSKTENIIIAVTAVIVLAAVIVLFTFSGLRRNSALRANASLSKAKAVTNAVWVSEGIDLNKLSSITDANGLSNANQTAQTVTETGFDTVFLKTEYLYDKNLKVKYKSDTTLDKFKKQVETDSEKLQLLKMESSAFSSHSLNVILAVDIMTFDSVISALMKQNAATGFIITGCDTYPAEFVNERLKAITSAAKEANSAAVIYADFDSDKNLNEITFDSEHMTYLSVQLHSENGDASAYMEKINTLLSQTNVGLVAGFRCEQVCDEKSTMSAYEFLCQVVSVDNCSKLAARAFHSLSDFTANRDNSTATVMKYVKSGLDLKKALTKLELDGLTDSIINTQETTYSFKVNCSDSFSLYINGYCYGVVGENFCNITVDLRHGENKITVVQGGSTLNFTVNCTKPFDGELISFITPYDPTYYSGKQTIQITVGAFYQASLKAKLGDKELELKPLGTSNGDYTVFSASVKLPKSGKKVKEMGKITVEATYNGQTKTYDGGTVFVNAKSTSKPSQNYDNQLSGQHDSYQNQVVVSGNNLTPYTDNGISGTNNFIMVSALTAETFPSDPNSPYYNPEYCLWTQGTIDRVIGESKHTNGDGDTFDMYELASGRRIVKEDVTYIPSGHELPDNSVGVISSNGNNGLEVTLSTVWRVPYSVNRYNQNYFSGYENKKYNVTSHTVSVIDFVFFNTPTHSGQVNTSGSSIVEKAEWVNDAASGTSILRFYLKKQGGFYGCSVNYDSNGNLNIKFKQPKASLSGKVIIVDPGHGGIQSGATGRNGSVYESHQTLKISKYLAEYLTQAGAAVYMTRTEDVDVSLESRRRMTEQLDPELFISIHLNASENKSRSGTSTFYYKAFSQPLASCIHNRLTQVYKSYCYDDNAAMYSAIDSGANYYPFYVTRTDICPSVLVEVGFITNDLECAYLVDDAYQQVFAQAIYKGIADYVAANH